MESSEGYPLLKYFIEHRLLVIKDVELLELVNTLQSQGRITIDEGNELLKLGEYLTGYDLAINE